MSKEEVLLGLTGPTGAGKSTVALAFLQLGWRIVEADRIARTVVETHPECLEALAKEFGDEILENGKLNRKKLAAKAFSTPEGGKRLNAITHPLIMKEIRRQIKEYFAESGSIVVLDAPLLFESGADEFCDTTLGVLAPAEDRLRRIMARDGISEEAARQRMKAQPQEVFYRERCEHILENTGSKEVLFDCALAFGKCLEEGRSRG